MLCKNVAELTGLEPATSYVTGRRSNQLSYSSTFCCLELIGSSKKDCKYSGRRFGFQNLSQKKFNRSEVFHEAFCRAFRVREKCAL